VPPSGSANATFDVPGEQSDLRVSPGLVLRRTSKGGRTEIEAALDPGTATQVWWSSRETTPSAPPRDLRLLADVKTLVTIGDADLRLLTLIDVTVVQENPPKSTFVCRRATNWRGSAHRWSEAKNAASASSCLSPTRRVAVISSSSISRERRAADQSKWRVDSRRCPRPSARRANRGRRRRNAGDLLDRDSGASPHGRARGGCRAGLRRAAVLLAAYRYQRGPTGPPNLALNVTRFPDAAVLAAMAERAEATTLVTSEGRALTEVSLWLRNRAQPFMKVALPAGASLLSVEVAGSPAKPVEGTDGMRVPLLRPGFRPDGLYKISFVYLHTGTPFAKKGDMQMTLPKMDLPVGVVEWELFVPKGYRADRFDGSAIAAELVQALAAPASEGAIASKSIIPAGLLQVRQAEVADAGRSRTDDSRTGQRQRRKRRPWRLGHG
jgi:hypothetical protein